MSQYAPGGRMNGPSSFGVRAVAPEGAVPITTSQPKADEWVRCEVRLTGQRKYRRVVAAGVVDFEPDELGLFARHFALLLGDGTWCTAQSVDEWRQVA